MRILVHGLQSSGASFFTFLLGQNPNSAVILDLYNEILMPELKEIGDDIDLIGKCVVGSKYGIKEHQGNFKPDKSILLLRHPIHNYKSLSNKPYSQESGTIDEKLHLADELLLNWSKYFDLVVHYEDIFFNRNLVVKRLNEQKIQFNEGYFQMERNLTQMVSYTKKQSPWLNDNYNVKWGTGNLRVRSEHLERKLFKPYSPVTTLRVKTHCPHLLTHYRNYKPKAHWYYHHLWLKSWYHHLRLKLYKAKENIKHHFN